MKSQALTVHRTIELDAGSLGCVYAKISVDIVYTEPELPYFRGGWVIVGHDVDEYFVTPESAITPQRLRFFNSSLDDELKNRVDKWVCVNDEQLAEQATRQATENMAAEPEE